MSVIQNKVSSAIKSGLFRGGISMAYRNERKQGQKINRVWDDEAATCMIAIRSRLAILFFTELARPSACDLKELHNLREELALLEKLRLSSTSAQRTQ